MNRILHIVNTSGLENHALGNCLAVLSKADVILFIENGIYNSLDNNENRQVLGSHENRLFTLLPDLLARGYGTESVLDDVDVVGYEEFVDLVVEFNLCLSW